jgi:hypothetical protein
VTITVSNLIWFIDNASAAATSDGRRNSPFKTLADFNAGSTPTGDLTYIEHTGTNYTDNDGTLTFAGAATEEQTWMVNVSGDLTVEMNETFQATLGTPSVAGVAVSGSPQTWTITNDDVATVSFAGNVSQSEATTPQTFTVNLSNPVDVDVSVEVTTTDASAETSDSDYTALNGQLVTIVAGNTSQTVGVTIGNDNKVEADETFTLGMADLEATGRSVSLVAPSLVTGTIENNDTPPSPFLA